ncbi:hypothetical protein CAP31_11285 [Sulfuriferula sp. AH1]|uniref:hypothetical protein n=1 Tax=Sulfuriferula sp. AH1 TaxID=1985873 RepID=UPI000B3B2CA4|nr:hypothetical protein [Sulfuriferula sp. AH1]ARU32205.1 hypothetical protein CAP31_11285 [Sulfuriferula sp. AH1]
MTKRYYLGLALLLASVLAQAADMSKIGARHLMHTGFAPIPSGLAEYAPRRSQDNATTAPHFIVGGKIKDGLYSKPPALQQPENDNLTYDTGFRNPYTTGHKKWRRLPASSMPGSHFPGLNIIRT